MTTLSSIPFKRLFICYFLSFWPHHAACGILVPRPGIEHVPPEVEAWSLNHWTTWETPNSSILPWGIP